MREPPHEPLCISRSSSSSQYRPLSLLTAASKQLRVERDSIEISNLLLVATYNQWSNDRLSSHLRNSLQPGPKFSVSIVRPPCELKVETATSCARTTHFLRSMRILNSFSLLYGNVTVTFQNIHSEYVVYLRLNLHYIAVSSSASTPTRPYRR